MKRNSLSALTLRGAYNVRRLFRRFYLGAAPCNWLPALLPGLRALPDRAAQRPRRACHQQQVERRQPPPAPVRKRPWLWTAALALDVAAFNLTYYFLLRASAFHSIGYQSVGWVVLWALLFAAVVIAMGRLPVEGCRQTKRQVAAMLTACFALALVVWRLTHRLPEEGDSWLLSELIKLPLWTRMLIGISPFFTAAYALIVLALLRWTAGGGARWPLAAAAGTGAAAAIPIFATALSGFGHYSRSSYWILFVGPLAFICVAALAKRPRLAFRTTPLALGTLLMGLSYVGALPVNSLADLSPWGDPAAALERIPGASLVYRPTAAEARTDFRFSRRMARVGGNLALAAGPMGHTRLFTVDDRTGEKRRDVLFKGLVRDMMNGPDGTELWVTDWEYAGLGALDPTTLEVKCRKSLDADQIRTPWNMTAAGGRIYMTTVTYPVLAEFAVPPDGDICKASLTRKINFYEAGLTPFTDGAFAVDVDPARGTILVTIGMTEGRYMLDLIEIGLDDFRVRRTLRFPSGVRILPIPGTRRILLPAYYASRIFEVDLDQWRVTRTIPSAPNIYQMAYDQSRRMIYASSRSAGTLQAIDYGDGRIVRSDFIGNKAEAMLYEGDRLFIATRWGIVGIDLNKYVGPPAAR